MLSLELLLSSWSAPGGSTFMPFSRVVDVVVMVTALLSSAGPGVDACEMGDVTDCVTDVFVSPVGFERNGFWSFVDAVCFFNDYFPYVSLSIIYHNVCNEKK